jgi:hypothetical protein
MSLETSINALAVKLGQDYKILIARDDNEAAARAAADTTLTTNLTNEINTRVAQGATLQTAITAATTEAATDATNKVAAEAAARAAADTTLTNTISGLSVLKADSLGRNKIITQNTIITTWADTLPQIGKYSIVLTAAQGALPVGSYYIELDRQDNDAAATGWKHVKAISNTANGLEYFNIELNNVWQGWSQKVPTVTMTPTGGGSDKVFYLNDNVVTTNYTIPANKNAMSAGPVTIANGVTVDASLGSWTIV